jgi:parallel beta-helix repeat protein
MMSEMIQNKKLLFSLFVVLLLINSEGQLLSHTVEEEQDKSVSKLNSINKSIAQEFVSHAPITVTNDTELAAVANSGNGTINYPYIIASWNITGSSTNGIHITGTTKHFMIKNCWINGSTQRAIFVGNITTGTATIINNTCNNNRKYGISLYESKSSTIVNNTCNNNKRGGISLSQSGSSTVANNSFFKDGLVLMISSKEDLLSYTVENNTVNGLPLGYFENLTASTITETYGQLILINCNNTSVKNQNYSNTAKGMALYYCYESQLINNTCNDNSHSGLSLYYSGFSTLINNTCNNNSGSGILLWYSNSSTLTNNYCESNEDLGISLSYSQFLTVTNNTSNENYYGLILSYSEFSALTNNICNTNNRFGIALQSSLSTTLANNTCNNNGEYGIHLSNSNFLSITNNTLNDNGEGNIYFYNSGTNTTITTITEPTTNETKTSWFSSPSFPYAVLIFLSCLIYIWIIQIRKKTR